MRVMGTFPLCVSLVLLSLTGCRDRAALPLGPGSDPPLNSQRQILH
jgi:hypothetical protein